jgi:hypothetical protein
MNDIDMLIDDLTGSLKPVRSLTVGGGRLLFAGIGLASIFLAVALMGMRTDLTALAPDPITLISSGLFFLFGVSCGITATRMARPAVGAASDGWRWALAAMLLLPGIALGEMLFFPALRGGASADLGVVCLERGLVASLATAVFLTLWLRRGAPVRIELAAWLVGFAAGSVGAVAIALTCPDGDIGHVGIWHTAIIIVSGGLARLSLPRLLRW